MVVEIKLKVFMPLISLLYIPCLVHYSSLLDYWLYIFNLVHLIMKFSWKSPLVFHINISFGLHSLSVLQLNCLLFLFISGCWLLMLKVPLLPLLYWPLFYWNLVHMVRYVIISLSSLLPLMSLNLLFILPLSWVSFIVLLPLYHKLILNRL